MSLRRIVTPASSILRPTVAVRFGGHGHGHHHHHEQKVLTKLPLGPKYPGGRNWGLFVGVNEDPTRFGQACICVMGLYIYFVYYYHTGF